MTVTQTGVNLSLPRYHPGVDYRCQGQKRARGAANQFVVQCGHDVAAIIVIIGRAYTGIMCCSNAGESIKLTFAILSTSFPVTLASKIGSSQVASTRDCIQL
jgi:hypothetical protein